MKYLINLNGKFDKNYSREEVQRLIDSNIIGLETEIWAEEWGEWRRIIETDFFLKKSVLLNHDTSGTISSKKNKFQRIMVVIGITLLYIMLSIFLVFLVSEFISEALGKIFVGIVCVGSPVYGRAARSYIIGGRWELV